MKKERSFSYDDFEKFLKTIPKLLAYTQKSGRPPLSPEVFSLLFKMMFYCALRPNEVIKIKKSDIDLEKMEIKVALSAISKLPIVTITPNLVGELGDYLKNLNNNDYLFLTDTTNKTKYINRHIMWQYAKDVGNLAGLKIFRLANVKSVEGMGLLQFRNSYKNYMLNHKADNSFVEIKLRMKTSNSYGNYDKEDLKRWERGQFKFSLSSDDLKKYIEWYTEKESFFDKLAQKIKMDLEQILDAKKIHPHNIDARAKEISDFKEKLQSGFSYNPKNMQDLAGIRVICYVKSDVDKVCEVIENKDNFEIDYNRSSNRAKILGEDKMGYSSVHYVAKLSKSRTQHEENKQYENIFFEIQVKTILQHAWAEIQHDEMYKRRVNLEPEQKRRFYLVSSLLESADNEFNTLHQTKKPEIE